MSFARGRGFITYPHVDRARAVNSSSLVGEALAHYESAPEITRVEWKTRGHDHVPALHDELLGHGFIAEESESIMIGQSADLAVDVELPAGVRLRQVSTKAEVRAMCAMQDEAFGDPVSEHQSEAVLQRPATDDGMELWVAEAKGQILSAGCLGRRNP